jgi:ABC-2 type transport system permease protein
MRIITVFRKTMREMSRDLWVLALTLAFAPFFVLLYWVWSYGGSTSYTVLVLDHDPGITLPGGESFRAGEAAIQSISAVSYADGKPLLKIVRAADRAATQSILRQRGAVAFIEFPADFSQNLAALKNGDRSVTAKINFGGDLTNPYYTVGALLALTAVDNYVQGVTGQQSFLQYVEEPLAGSAARSEFETYVPGVIVFATILLVFQAAMTVAREIESGALRRLRLTPMTAFDLTGGISAALVLVGVTSILLTFGTAVALGFRSQGPLWVAVLVGALSSLAVIGIGMLVACFTRTVSQAFVVANFPLGLMMFFSGAIFPMPKVILFSLGGHDIGLYDFLPTTYAVAALNKVLTLGASLSEVSFELTALLVLSLLYFGIGAWLFQRRYLRLG